MQFSFIMALISHLFINCLTHADTPTGFNNTHDYFAAVRQKRNTITTFVTCNKFNQLQYVQNCMKKNWNLQCRIKAGSCYYMVTCRKLKTITLDYKCEQTHITFTYPHCCDYVCP